MLGFVGLFGYKTEPFKSFELFAELQTVGNLQSNKIMDVLNRYRSTLSQFGYLGFVWPLLFLSILKRVKAFTFWPFLLIIFDVAFCGSHRGTTAASLPHMTHFQVM